MPSVAAGVIIATPPGGNRGSIAVVLVPLPLFPPVTLPILLALDPEFELEFVFEFELELLPLVCGEADEAEFVFDGCCDAESLCRAVDGGAEFCVEDACCDDEPCCCLAASAAGLGCSNDHGHAADNVTRRIMADRSEVILVFFMIVLQAQRPQ